MNRVHSRLAGHGLPEHASFLQVSRALGLVQASRPSTSRDSVRVIAAQVSKLDTRRTALIFTIGTLGLGSACCTSQAEGMSGPAQAANETQVKYTLKTSGGGTYKVAGGEQLNVATAGAQALLRAGSGAFVSDKLSTFKNRPAKPIQLYEFEGCPFCRKVREACSILDIDIEFFPCPQNGPTWRAKVQSETGKAQFPYLVDPNNGKKMHESSDIIQYLFEQYGDGDVPVQFKGGPLDTVTAGLGLLPRTAQGKGLSYRKSKLPDKPLDIWGYESSPFVKIAREALVELEIPHIYHTVARNSPKREEMTKKWDQFQVPYLEDPNTGLAMFESNVIVDYLNQTYAIA